MATPIKDLVRKDIDRTIALRTERDLDLRLSPIRLVLLGGRHLVLTHET